MSNAAANRPLVSCIMPTADRRAFIRAAVRYFLRQDYEPKELIIIDDGREPVNDLIPHDERLRYIRVHQRMTIGAKRNLACEQARGEIIAHWDDDDWQAPHRLSYQVKGLIHASADVCGIKELLFYEPERGRAWRYLYPSDQKPWLSGSTLCYRRSFWADRRFPDINVGEDARFIWDHTGGELLALEDAKFHVGIIHRENASPKQTGGQYWSAFPVEEIRRLMGDDWEFHSDSSSEKQYELIPAAAVIEPERRTSAPAALVSAAFGIGDILRVTPLIRVLDRLGYQVDVLVAPDYTDVCALLEGAPEIRHLYCYENFRSNQGSQPLPQLSREFYEVATFTLWSGPLRNHVRARRTFEFAREQWLKDGDIACVENIARELGWTGALPPPFAVVPESNVALSPNTIALHPGCKSDWPWKKWHGFEDLARRLQNVVVIGTASDLENEKTYFGKPFQWPEHVRSFVGDLNLQETAALLKQCAALISNDSGMMHLGVAVGIPTFGVFGITNPRREVIPAPNMFSISKGLRCEAACREGTWGRRDCEHHLECLKTLSAAEVLHSVHTNLPGLQLREASSSHGTTNMDEISLVYYGNVFDASGYGHAARAYIHALHRAGIQLSVVDLTNHPKQVHDELVESLLDRPLQADFHLFHGIPTQWAHYAFRLPNAIGMTVWETDVMPSQWRNALNHVLEIWLPCEYNVSVFSESLEKPVFKLPHPLLPAQVNGDALNPEQFLHVSEKDFVFYSIFEWQERKSPEQLIEAYLRAFDHESETLLLVKANPGAEEAARQALARAREQTGSGARVELRCEAWSVAQIEALHARGDCYVSMHRGEGWGYPMFDAASRGTPVLATNYSGPLEYLNPRDHYLVRYQLSAVRQPYVYYHPQMQWAEPDITHASELMRKVLVGREKAKAQAARAARSLRKRYSLEAIGEAAKSRLMQLLQQQQPDRWRRMKKRQHGGQLTPSIPIPPDWYDEDYFEHGLKSNWEGGYHWKHFAPLFKETAQFLTETFTDAQTFLDIGCAKGFLVRALRERGKECFGFDFSPWAIEQAEESVKPYLHQVSVDDASFDRQFDFLLAFSIFETLTEAQLDSFLSRARAWTGQALLAVIPSFPTEEEARAYKRDDRDLSHITMQSRQWWHEKFLENGWRQDQLHKLAQRLCQQHRLPTRMRWPVYVYVPA